jgi:phosphoglycerate dehydrogenase-like enzyme
VELRLILIQLVSLTWALILGLSKNLKTEIDNMYQGYWQTTVGFELKGKIIGLIGLGRVGSQVAKDCKRIWYASNSLERKSRFR